STLIIIYIISLIPSHQKSTLFPYTTLFRSSDNSALTYLVIVAIPPNDNESIGNIIDLNLVQVNVTSVDNKIGSKSHLNATKYCNKAANTKDGTDINKITIKDKRVSIQVFFFSAAKIPNAIPTGIVNIKENMFN